MTEEFTTFRHFLRLHSICNELDVYVSRNTLCRRLDEHVGGGDVRNGYE